MGFQSRLYGVIEEAWPGMRTDGSEHRRLLLSNCATTIEKHNEEVLAGLPEQDAWPPLNRPMFGWARAEAPMINYRTRMFHFAASLKEVDFELRDWLDKFEDLLRRLYWEKAVLHFQGGYLGEHRFDWRPRNEWVVHLTDGVLVPIEDWQFTTSMELSELEQFRQAAK